MRVITVELLNDKALKLLQQLEQLNILRLVGTKKQADSSVELRSTRKWAGSISADTADQMLKNADQSRQEWERNI